MRAVVMDRAVVETGAMVAAGALVGTDKVVKSGELWAGVPARKLRDLTEAEAAFIEKSAAQYVDFGIWHKCQGKTLSRFPP
mmetsp:Transcript_58832/g.157251  ORF Transcript_58832/g.157251 Transcript_58832/m.157251 type:complete len:81 (-) Transcript_58832:74-316(-)